MASFEKRVDTVRAVVFFHDGPLCHTTCPPV